MIPFLLILWAAGIAVILRDLDQEQTRRRKAAQKVYPLSQDQEAAREHYRQRDRARVDAMRATRYQDQQAWEIRYQEACHIRHIRQFRLMWDGVVRIGEDVA